MRTRVRTRSTFHANSRGKIALINRRTAIELLVGLDFDVFHPHAGTAMRHACPMRNKATVSPLWQSSCTFGRRWTGAYDGRWTGNESGCDVGEVNN